MNSGDSLNGQTYIKPTSRARTSPARETIAMSQTSEAAATAGAAAKPASLAAAAAHRWWILATAGIAQLMVVLDATIVNIALPTAQRDLGFSNADRQWVITAYSLAFGSLLLGGRIADRIGRKTTFLIGVTGFAAASA